MGISQLQKAVLDRRTAWHRALAEVKYDMGVTISSSSLLDLSLKNAPTWLDVCGDMRSAVANEDRRLVVKSTRVV